jgi:hypothetical protein
MQNLGGLFLLTECARCFHPKENHINIDGTPKCVCNGSLQCMCDTWEEPYLAEFAQMVEKKKHELKTIKQRCEFILEKIPRTRNAGEKSFAKIYKEIWYGFKIRKEGTTLNTEEWKRMPHDDSINREKRRVKENPQLATYDPETIRKQNAIWEAYMELAIEK